MKLYYKTGACSLAARIVLHDLGLPYEAVKVDTAAGRTEAGEDFSKINPNGYVPALVLDDGEIVTENVALLEYLADSHPAAKLGAADDTPLARARLTEALSYLNSELHKAYGIFFANRSMGPEDREKNLAKLAKRLQTVETKLSDGRSFYMGERFTVADAYLFVLLSWSAPLKHDLSPYPKIQAYQARIGARPAVQAALKAEGLLKS